MSTSPGIDMQIMLCLDIGYSKTSCNLQLCLLIVLKGVISYSVIGQLTEFVT